MRGCSTLSPRLGLLNDLRRRFAIEIRVAPDQQTGAENTCVVDPDPCNDSVFEQFECIELAHTILKHQILMARIVETRDSYRERCTPAPLPARPGTADSTRAPA